MRGNHLIRVFYIQSGDERLAKTMELLMVGNSVGNGDARGRNGTLFRFAQLPCRACPNCISAREDLGHLFTNNRSRF